MSIELFVTDWDRQRYEGRKQIADEQQTELDAAIAACGPGALAYGVWVIRDRTGVLPDQRYYCCRREDGAGWVPKAPESDERLTAATHKGYVMNGMTVYPFRFSVHFGALDEYRPVPPEQLAERRARRHQRKLEGERTELQQCQRYCFCKVTHPSSICIRLNSKPAICPKTRPYRSARRKQTTRRRKGTMDANDLFTRAELAQYLKVSVRQIDKLRKDDAFPKPVLLGGSPRWRKHLIDAYLGQLQPVSEGAAR